MKLRKMKLDPQWLAGFIDGDGCITTALNGGRRVPQVDISQKDVRILEVIQEHYGGYLSKHATNNVHHLKYLGSSVRGILNAILPYLVMKTRRATWALEMLEHFPGSGNRLTETNIAERNRLAALIMEANQNAIEN